LVGFYNSFFSRQLLFQAYQPVEKVLICDNKVML